MLNSKIMQRVVLVGIGFIQGFFFYALRPLLEAKGVYYSLHVSVLYFVIFWGLMLQMAWNGERVWRLVVTTLIPALIFSAIFFWMIRLESGASESLSGGGNDLRFPTFIIASLISFKILLAFIQVAQERGSLRSPPYESLFNHSWNNALIILLAVLFDLIFFFLILLWMKLFQILKISVFSDLFTSRPFVFLVYPMVFGLGLSFGKESHRVLNTIRNVLITLFKTLLPLLSVIALLFLLTLPFKGIKMLWNTHYSSPLLLVLMGFTIFFINAIFQDGKTEIRYPSSIRWLVNLLLLSTPVFSGIVFYSAGLRINQYGVTPERFYILVFAFLTSLYGLGYSLAVFKKSEVWLGMMGSLNIVFAPIVVGIAILLHTPLLDPLKISAENQYQRLLQGKIDVEKFDFYFLKSRLGYYGKQKSDLLEHLTNHPNAQAIRDHAASATDIVGQLSMDTPEKLAKSLHILTKDGKIPENLMKKISEDVKNYRLYCYVKQENCAIFSQNIDQDSEDEYFVLVKSRSEISAILYKKGVKGWIIDGSFRPRCEKLENGCAPVTDSEDDDSFWESSFKKMINALKENTLEKIPARYNDFKIGSWEFYYTERSY